MGAYPDGCTQAMHDRAFGNEDREACQTCDGDGLHVEIPCECVRCSRCDGSGVEQWSIGDEFNSHGESTCGTCEGTGVVTDDCPLHYEPCQTCDGGGATFRLDENGDVENKPCIDCKGTGYEQPADTREDDAYEQSREDEGADDAF